MDSAAPEPEQDLAPPAARTSLAIYLALALFAFAVATPFLAGLDARDAPRDGWAGLGVFVKWMAVGGASALLGIVCTIIGARRGANTPLTMIATLLAGIAGIGFLALLAVALR
ncbi:MAG TPA: hypothetical protein VFP37_00130 [Steroidobacteraceae bacterium]|nr:hypothetical protein [Steroidobacteraceae bacterium]